MTKGLVLEADAAETDQLKAHQDGAEGEVELGEAFDLGFPEPDDLAEAQRDWATVVVAGPGGDESCW